MKVPPLPRRDDGDNRRSRALLDLDEDHLSQRVRQDLGQVKKVQCPTASVRLGAEVRSGGQEHGHPSSLHEQALLQPGASPEDEQVGTSVYGESDCPRQHEQDALQARPRVQSRERSVDEARGAELPRVHENLESRRVAQKLSRGEATIVCDTREQKAYEFSGFRTVRKKLDCGDYAWLGHEGECVVERKEKSDAWACVGASRHRFVACLIRLAQVRSPAIVIEASLDDFCNPPSRTRLTPAQAVGAYISWSQEYRIPVFWCPSRAYAERVCLKWLLAFQRHLHAPTRTSP